MFCVCIARGNDPEIMFVADVLHHPLQCREPDWSTSFCTDPKLAAKTRRGLFEEIADGKTLIVPEHVPFPTVGRIDPTATGSAIGFHFRGGASSPSKGEKKSLVRNRQHKVQDGSKMLPAGFGCRLVAR